ncbi:MAG: CRISPR-associated endonuclease Cas3'' [Gammaproteobacteria bacterium]|nr:CRISPR-associated endonuclease Cas3'' [Gammaproteobacteria bacterium]
MMVTFISQCEKKALPKTRRVLDAFANRIGDRTWQTVITNEGLQAVKKLLRRTASKNTAVSCHWIRSRSRTELHWIVGNQDKFNTEGYVPVNYTNQINVIKMDDIEINIKTYYANTKKQPLDQHLFAVGYIARQIIQTFFADEEVLAEVAYTSGCGHDPGKIDPEFQKWILDKTRTKLVEELPEDGQHIDKKSGKGWFEKHSRHNEISLLLFHLAKGKEKFNQASIERIAHAIYWHHARPFRKSENEIKDLFGINSKLGINLFNTEKNEFLCAFNQIIQAVNDMAIEYDDALPKLDLYIDSVEEAAKRELQKSELPRYKDYYTNENLDDYRSEILRNAKNNLVRAAVIQADRLVSSISKEALNEHIEEGTLHTLLEEKLIQGRGLTADIEACLRAFTENANAQTERNEAQSQTAKELQDVAHISILQGPAGCGKTKIALEWAANTNARKIIWICPRVQVCLGLINDLTSKEYLPNTKIEINTGEHKLIYQHGGLPIATPEGEEFSGDVVITTIDQIINTVTTHNKITGLIQYIQAHVVFDEFHEYINMPAFNLLFAELVECKKLQGENARALLVSATPNYFFLRELLDIDEEEVKSIASFNQSEYGIQFTSFDETKQDDSNPFYQSQPENTFVISNTAITAQKSFIRHQGNENGILIHSKYKKDDKKKLFDEVFESFRLNGSRRYDVLRSGPIVQASLNISSDRMITELTLAENWLQRLGRLDRFGKNTAPNVYITAIPETIVKTGKQTGACAKFLASLNSFQSAKAWYDCLQDKLADKKTVKLSEIYQIYREFYQSDHYLDVIEQDLINALKKGVQLIGDQLNEPISFPNRKLPKDKKVKIPKSSLRGDSRFVQMAVCSIDEQENCEWESSYAYVPTNFEANLTYPVKAILGYENSRQNLLAHMAKKHHNIADVKKSYNDKVLLNEARNPETPVYLSYTPEDLQKVGGESQRHPYAVYYAIGQKQPIGAISMIQLQTAEEY